MLIFTTKNELQKHLATLSGTIGFVPTMGALHSGHLSLMEKSLAETDITVMSIFINPTQFDNKDDLAKYPKTLEKDIEIMKTLSDKIIVYAPEVSDIYGDNVNSDKFDYDGIEFEMEGKHRIGHFDGVGTVVKRLFEIVGCNKSYFGEKDFQQLQIVTKMVQKANMPVEIIPCPVFRESNGLAMSSRNIRLSIEEKEKASLIYKTLQEAKRLFETQNSIEISKFVAGVFENHPMFRLEYFEIADETTLKTCIEKQQGQKYRGFIAVFCGSVRLIDTLGF